MKYIAFCLLSLSILSACTTMQKPVNDGIENTSQLIDQSLSESTTPPLPAAPADILQELDNSLPEEVTTGVFAKEFLAEPTFDISVANAPAHAFFMGLVKQSEDNMLVHPSVSGSISLDLKNVTLSEVMELVREVYGYEYKKTKTGYIVLPAGLVSKVFHVNYLNVVRGGESNMTVSSGQQSSNSTDSTTTDSSTTTTSSSTSDTASTSVITSTSADFWKGLSVTLQAIIGNKAGRTVVIDSQSGLVVVKALPAELRDVETYLAQAQKNLQRQVILEAKIIEVTLSDGYQAGIDWAALAQQGSSSAFVGQLGSNGSLGNTIDSSGEFSLTNTVSNTNSALGNMLTYGIAGDGFGAIIRLLNTQGDVQVLSSPRISTVNNQKAVIKVGSDEYFVTGVTSSTSTDGNTSTSDATIERFFSGIALDVTPQISETDEVILHIHPSVSDVTSQTKSFTVNGKTQSLPLAFSKVRESDTIIKAKNSQVVVIGGLMQNTSSDTESSVPGVSEVPILGGLFGQTEKQSTRSELVILLKPIVVSSDDDWSTYISNTQQRIRSLRNKQK